MNKRSVSTFPSTGEHSRWMRLLVLVALLAGCNYQSPGSRQYQARLAQEQKQAEFDRNCKEPIERTPAQFQWCMMRQHDLDRAEDAARDDEREQRQDVQRAVDQMNTTNKLNAIQTQQDYNTVMGK